MNADSNSLGRFLDRTFLSSHGFRCVMLVWVGFLLSGVSQGWDELETREPDAIGELSQRAVGLLGQKCGNCHGVEKSEGDLRLDSRERLFSGGTRGEAVSESQLVAAKVDQSLLMQSILGVDEELRMPPKDPLDASQIELIRKWLLAGALWPRTTMNKETSRRLGDAFSDKENPIRIKFGGQRLDLWSLRTPTRPEIPSTGDHAWVRNPIDGFVASSITESRAQPEGGAAPLELIKRLSFDLTGLPPSWEQVERFVEDQHPDAYDRLVDQLLASPEYGVHFARMWLDVVRYSDSNGFDWDELRPDAWRYRDYVIRAWNGDRPFDQFVCEQLAGDLIQDGPPKSEDEQDRLIATGYLRMGPHDNAASLFNEQDRSRAELMADLTETTGSAFLGLTLSCCRCHDHKTDPLSQDDHYRLRAFFAGVEFADDLPIDFAEEQYRIRSQHAEIDTLLEPIDRDLKKLQKEDADCFAELQRARQELAKQKRSYTTGLLMRESSKDAPKTFVFYQGDHRSPRQEVAAGFPSVLDPNSLVTGDVASVSKGTDSDGALERVVSEKRTARLELARWIGSRRNPWTARVLVNRLWQVHFGEGLVATPNDFGFTGERPTNAELLDWLAEEFVSSGWSIKHVQRLIVTSSAYRQKAVPGGRRVASDGRVHVSMRKAFRRLSAEQIRDAMLACSGVLQSYSGGKPIWPELPPEILQANPAFLDDNPQKTKGWYPSPASQQSVRSLFLVQKRTVRVPWMETFDLPENSVSCARRETSIVAPQALTLLNGSLTSEVASALASRAREHSGEQDTQQIEFLFKQVLLRVPHVQELELGERFLKEQSLEELARALVNTNEFAFVP